MANKPQQVNKKPDQVPDKETVEPVLEGQGQQKHIELQDTIELEGGEVEITHQPATVPTLSTKTDPVEKKNVNLSDQIATELVELSKDVSRPISALKNIVLKNLPTNATRAEAQAYIKFFERLKRITEAAYLTAQEVTSPKL